MYQKHKFNFFPEMSAEDYDNLKNSMASGFDEKLGKIMLFQDSVLDGWNRYKACLDTGIEPIFEQFQGNEQQAFEYSIKANQDRRHLSKSQLAAVAIEAEPLWARIQENVEAERVRKISEARIKQEAERKERERLDYERQQQAIKNENERIRREKELKERLQKELDDKNKKEIEAERLRIEAEREAERIAELERLEAFENEKEIEEKIPQSNNRENDTRNKLATAFNTNERYISDAKKLKETNPEAFEQVKSGQKTISEVKKEIKKEAIENKKQDYFERIETKKGTTNKINIFETDKKFRVICADPPWSYNDKCETGGVQSGGVEIRHYNTMSTKSICNLPIKDISEKDSVLFLWVTSPLLEDGLQVIKEWGFKYKTSFIWDKVKHNMGHYNSVRHEFLLIATKGSCTPDNKKLYDSVQSIEKTDKHSEKPKEFMDIIDDLYTWGERIELFCRENNKENWLIWGNEV